MSYFAHHVFFCCNQRKEGEDCCNRHGASDMQTYAKERIAALGMKGPGKVRISKSGCLGRCDDGPVLVVYPDDVWYTFVDREDIDEIITEHLVGGRVVSRLRLPDEPVVRMKGTGAP